ncbi:MAG: hypothetical protein HC800_24110 [Phormidesmis sp. RL_2_1]|nr:hypothetical protein [Phormidesmis sp. RL_2_1]
MKRFFVGLAIVAAAVGGGIGYAAMKTMATPDWYSEGSSEIPTETATDEAARDQSDQADQALVAETVSPNDVVISANELNTMVTDAIASRPYTAPILDATKGVRTAIDNGRIESGAVINLGDLPTESFPLEGQQAIEQLTNTFPFLANRDVYVGIEGRPKVVDGSLSLDDTHIKLGQLKLPIASVASQLGLSAAELEQQIDALLAQQGLTPDDVKIVDGQIVITNANP